LFGLRRPAQRLSNGFQALCVYGTSKTDKDLTFSSTALELLEAALPGNEQQASPLVWRPRPAGGAAAAAGGAEGVDDADSTSAAICEGCSAVQQQDGQTMNWQVFNYTQLAGVYSMLYKTSVPSYATYQGPDGVENVVQHNFSFCK
jgi:hypothetical protein